MSGRVAVDIIVEHRLDGFFTRAHPSREGYDSVTRCTCDWVSYEDAAGEMQARKIHAEHQVSVLAASGHTIMHSPMTTAFRDATRDLIGKEAWVYGMSEGELRDIVTRAVIAAAAAEEDTNG